jgi:predicted GNAT family N-acyltransferase
MDIRPYTSDDFDACMLLLTSNIPTYFHDADKQDFTDFLASPPGTFLVASDGSTIIACGGVALERGTMTAAVLCYGMVVGTRLRQGIGQRLLRKRLDAFFHREPQVEVVKVNTSQKTEGFYLKIGFNVTERAIDGYGPGLDRVSLAAAKPVLLQWLENGRD